MKKILFLLLSCGFMLSAFAQVPDTANDAMKDTSSTIIVHKYFYYPSSNVYFDEATGNYWYWDNSTSQWITTHELPSTITLVEPKYPLDYTGNEPFQNNSSDLKKYKVTKSGKVIKKDDDKKVKTKPTNDGQVKIKAKDKS